MPSVPLAQARGRGDRARTARASGHPLLGMGGARFFMQVFILKALPSVPLAVPHNGPLGTPGFICTLVDLAP